MASSLKLTDGRVSTCLGPQSLDALPGVLGSAGHTSELRPLRGLLPLTGRWESNLVGGNICVWESGHQIIWAAMPAV